MVESDSNKAERPRSRMGPRAEKKKIFTKCSLQKLPILYTFFIWAFHFTKQPTALLKCALHSECNLGNGELNIHLAMKKKCQL